jgi:hypothetical protein
LASISWLDDKQAHKSELVIVTDDRPTTHHLPLSIQSEKPIWGEQPEAVRIMQTRIPPLDSSPFEQRSLFGLRHRSDDRHVRNPSLGIGPVHWVKDPNDLRRGRP